MRVLKLAQLPLCSLKVNETDFRMSLGQGDRKLMYRTETKTRGGGDARCKA